MATGAAGSCGEGLPAERPKRSRALLQRQGNEDIVERGQCFQACDHGLPARVSSCPSARNSVFDDVLRILESLVGREFVAYADDLQVIIAANTRRSLEEKAQRMADAVAAGWCRGAGLTLSGAKTEMVFLKFVKHPGQAASDRRLGSRLFRERANPSDWNIWAPVVKVDGTFISIRRACEVLASTLTPV